MKAIQPSGLFTAGLLAAVLAFGAAASATPQGVASQDLENVSFSAGIVMSIDPRAGVMTVNEAGSSRVLTFEIPRGIEIVKDEASIGIGGIQVGDPVAIEYRESGQGPTAISVKVITPPRED